MESRVFQFFLVLKGFMFLIFKQVLILNVKKWKYIACFMISVFVGPENFPKFMYETTNIHEEPNY